MRLVRGCLVMGISLVSPLALVAGQATKKFDLVPGKAQTVTVEVDSVRVNQVVLDIENAGGKGPLKKSGAEAEVRMDNKGARASRPASPSSSSTGRATSWPRAPAARRWGG
jgi:hypothetical protein